MNLIQPLVGKKNISLNLIISYFIIRQKNLKTLIKICIKRYPNHSVKLAQFKTIPTKKSYLQKKEFRV